MRNALGGLCSRTDVTHLRQIERAGNDNPHRSVAALLTGGEMRVVASKRIAAYDDGVRACAFRVHTLTGGRPCSGTSIER